MIDVVPQRIGIDHLQGDCFCWRDIEFTHFVCSF